jgi:D-arabinose 1-dehydrogenase-like Zn-dependent alcohol dehydrogenase
MSNVRMGTAAAVLPGVGEPLQLRDLELEAVGDCDVAVRVEHDGVCGTDLHIQ